MKKWSKKIWAAVAAATLAVSVAGCGGSDSASGGESKDDVQALITKAQETMTGVESMRTKMDMAVGMAMGEESYDTTTTAEVSIIQKPLKMEMNMSVSVGTAAEAAQQIQMFAEEKDGKYISYLGYGGTWYAEEMELSDLEQYNTEETMNLYLKNLESFSKTGEEEIDGKTAAKIEGVITGEAMEEALETSGVTASAANVGMEEEELDALYKDMGNLPITLWIDADGYVLKYEMDMSEMMQSIMNHSLNALSDEEKQAQEDLKITKALMTMVCSDFNAVNEIEIPAEALSATVAAED